MSHYLDKEDLTKFIQDLKDSEYLVDIIDYVQIEAYIDEWIDKDLEEELTTWIYEHEVIYYHVAIEWLANNDPSLSDSMELAQEYDMKPKNITSEYLATVLQQQYAIEELSELLSKY